MKGAAGLRQECSEESGVGGGAARLHRLEVEVPALGSPWAVHGRDNFHAPCVFWTEDH